MKHNQQYILYFMAFVILVIVLYIAGNNVMNAYEEKEKIVNNSNLIHKKLNLKPTNVNAVTNVNGVVNEVTNVNGVTKEVSEVNNRNIGVIKTPNWRKKVKNHMDYKHGNPLMYNNKVKILYDDL